MKSVIASVVLCLLPLVLYSQSKQADATPVPKTKEADMTVVGIHLGEKFSIPECKREQDRDFPYGFGSATSSICFKRGDVRTTKPNAPVDTDEVGILLPDKDTPLGVMVNVVATTNNLKAAIVAQIVDGNIEAVTIYTMGLHFQDAVLAMLKGKYGDPSSFEEESKQNAFGAVFSSHLARWLEFRNLVITFQGTAVRTDVGVIQIWTDKGGEYLLERAKQRTQVRPKL